MKSYIKNEAD